MPLPRFALFSLFTLLIAAEGARAADKEKLRQAVHLPTITAIVGYGVNDSGEFEPLSAWTVQPEQIAQNEKELKGDATDAERYHRLARLYDRAKQPDKGKEARHKEIALRRAQLQQHPEDRRCKLRLAEALKSLNQEEEAEALVRGMVKERPTDWEAWLTLGKVLDSKCWHEITPGKRFIPGGPERLLQTVREAQPTPERIAASQRYRQEAVACFDRAVELAPHEAKPYRVRGSSCYGYGMLQCGLRLYKGERADFFEYALGREALPDLRKAVDLDQREFIGLGMLAQLKPYTEMYDRRNQTPPATKPTKLIDILSETTRKQLREDMARLEKRLQDPDHRKAAEAAEVLGFLQSTFCNDFVAAEKSLRLSIQLDPSRESARNLLYAIMSKTGKYLSLVALIHQRLKTHDSAHNRLSLAKAYEHLDLFDKAGEIVQEGLKREPENVLLKLALADLLLKHYDEESLKQAGEILSQLSHEKLAGGEAELRGENYLFSCGIYFGLTGESQRARECLERLRKQKPDYEGIEKALKALDE